MAFGLSTIYENHEILYNKRLIQVFHSVEFRYPPLRTSPSSPSPTTSFTLNIPNPPLNDGSDVGWMNSVIRPIDRVVDLGGVRNGIAFGISYKPFITSVRRNSRTQYIIEITPSPGSPSDFEHLTFYAR